MTTSSIIKKRDKLNKPARFIRLLCESPTLFTSYRYLNNIQLPASPTPSIADTAAHLKLLRAFSVAKKRVLALSDEEDVSSKNWQVYVTNAVRRFIIFVSCLKHVYGTTNNNFQGERVNFMFESSHENEFNEKLYSMLPPLDVLMVWHAFMLSPRSFYDNFMRNDFYKFANIPFPLHEIHKAINDETFEYEPAKEMKERYFDLINCFISGNALAQTYDLQRYDVSKGFNMFDYYVDIKCPNCYRILIHRAPYTDKKGRGFCDKGFSRTAVECRLYDPCKCNGSAKIDHDELRKRQLYRDSHSTRYFPGVYRHFSCILSSHSLRNCRKVDEQVKSSMLPWKDPSSNSGPSRDSSLILSQYLNMNLIHSTVRAPRGKPEMHILEISEDLVMCVMRQDNFADRMNNIDWLRSPVIEESLNESTLRYSRFFKLITQYNQRLVPTLDIDLIWHTHQLSSHYYLKDCFNTKFARVVEHDTEIEQDTLDILFEKTSKIYRSKFKQEYSICFCWYCVCARAKSKSSLGKLFRRKLPMDETMRFRGSPLYSNQLGLTHVSFHTIAEQVC